MFGRCIQKLHEGSSGDNSRKDKAAEGTILSQQEKGESSSFEVCIWEKAYFCRLLLLSI